MSVNMLQTQFHSCFCVQANHNSSWPRFPTTSRAACVTAFLCFLTRTPVRPLPSVFSVHRAADRLEEPGCSSAEAHAAPQAQASPTALPLARSWHLQRILNGQGERGCGQAAGTLRSNLKAFQTEITAELLVASAVV